MSHHLAEPPRLFFRGKHAAPVPWGDRVRTGLRGTGQTLITAGLVILLFVVYELWVTNLFNARTQHQLADQLDQEWAAGDDPLVSGPGLPGQKIGDIPLGDGIAKIRIPAFGLDWVKVVVEGADDAQLERGPGHYTDTALPGEVGNFSIAGHRVSKGSPFLHLDMLKPGDAIVVETQGYFYTYRVLGDPESGDLTAGDPDDIPGREIVSPSDTQVIAPVPDHPGRTPNRKMLTLTTCHPRFSAAQRMIIHAEMDGAPLEKTSPDVLPPALRP